MRQPAADRHASTGRRPDRATARTAAPGRRSGGATRGVVLPEGGDGDGVPALLPGGCSGSFGPLEGVPGTGRADGDVHVYADGTHPAGFLGDRHDREDAGGVTRKIVRRCSRCGSTLPPESRRSRRYCTATCRTRAWRQLSAQRAALDAGGEAMRALLAGDSHPWPRFKCAECTSTWYSSGAPSGLRKRSGSRYCSSKCRTRAWRRRHSL